MTTLTECEHRLVHASTFSEGKLAGQVALWSCDFCGVRFYPACPTCVDVGHRNVVHPVAAAREPLDAAALTALERLADLDYFSKVGDWDGWRVATRMRDFARDTLAALRKPVTA